MAAAGSTFYSVPIFQSDACSLDTTGTPIVVDDTATLPTLEHALWSLLGLMVNPDGTPSYLRNKVRSTKGFLAKAIETWDANPEIQANFGSLWMEQMMSSQETKDTLLSHASSSQIPEYYAILPKNKGGLYAAFGWNPDMSDRCENRLGVLLRSLVSSMRPQKSSITPVQDTTEDEEMIQHTFCPDCESLLFIQQSQKTEEATGQTHSVLFKHCQVCGWRKEMEEEEMKQPIYSSRSRKQQLQITDHDIEEILLDPTLPRINNIPCVNPVCATNHLVDEEYGFILARLDDTAKRDAVSSQDRAETIGETGLILYADTREALKARMDEHGFTEADGEVVKGPVERHILYYRTNAEDLSFSYICSTCKTIWSNDS